MARRFGFAKSSFLVILMLTAGLVLGAIWLGGSNSDLAQSRQLLTFQAKSSEFVSSIVEPGDVESSSNLEIRCRVKSQGRTGTAILEIIPEGEMVEKGDFLAQLDDSVLRCLLYTSPSPRDRTRSRMPSSA